MTVEVTVTPQPSVELVVEPRPAIEVQALAQIQTEIEVVPQPSIEVDVTPQPSIEVDVAINVVQGSGAGSATLTFEAENKSGGILKAGQPVAVHSSGVGVIKASSASVGFFCVGLLVADTDPGFVGLIQYTGPFNLDDWTNVTGSMTLNNSPYFVDAFTAGKLSSTPPQADGLTIQFVGKPISSTVLNLMIQPPILL